MSRKTKIIAKGQQGTQELQQNTDFIMSTGDDMQVLVWKIPPPLTQKQAEKKMEEEEGKAEDEDYCVLNIQTRHSDSIQSMVYLHDAIVTASKDTHVKVYNLNLNVKPVKTDRWH